MTHPIRPDVVRELVELLSDESLTIEMRVELAQNSDATKEESVAAILEFTGMTIAELRAAGTVEVEMPRVLSLMMRQLEAYAAIWGVLRRWDLILRNPTAYTLESPLKVIPPDQVNLIIEAIRYGGLR
jgi:hypothetical protein